MKNFQIPKISLLLGFISLMIYLIFGNAPENLIYNQYLVDQGEYWRIFTGQWVHSSFRHFFWNTLILLLMSSFLEHFFKRQILSMLAFGLSGVAFYLYFFSTVDYYCGLSGALNGLFIAGLAQLSCFKQWRLPVFLTLIGIILKTISESQNQTILVHDAWAVTPYAHIFGILAGILYVIYSRSYFIFWRKV